MMIPKLIHFIFGFAKEASKRQFFLCHLVAIKSARLHHPDHKIVLWLGEKPVSNVYWEEATQLCEIIHVKPPETIYGIPLMHYAHQADVFRLQVLKDHGGIYLDLDTITVQSFDTLHITDLGMAPEFNPNAQRAQGLCNATMIARRNAVFLHRWLDAYEFFNSEGRDINWEFHSVKLPLILARQVPHEITILPQATFFKFDWSAEGFKDLLERDVSLEGVYSIHLWESHIYNFLMNDTKEALRERRNTTYGRQALIALGEIEED